MGLTPPHELPDGYCAWDLTPEPQLGSRARRTKVTKEVMDKSLELLVGWLDGFTRKEIIVDKWQTEEALLNNAKGLHWISPLRWEPRWVRSKAAKYDVFSSEGWTQIDVDPYGDEGGAGTLHILAEIEESERWDYRGFRPGKKPKFLGFEVTWNVRMLLWDFDTTIAPFWNATTVEREHEYTVYAYGADDEMILDGEDESKAVKWEVYDAAPAQSPYIAVDEGHAKFLPLNGLRAQVMGDYYYQNNPRTVTCKPDPPAVL